MNLGESDWLLIQKGMWQSSKKSQDFWLPVMDYPRALDSSPEDRGLGVRDCLMVMPI